LLRITVKACELSEGDPPDSGWDLPAARLFPEYGRSSNVDLQVGLFRAALV
jgi:hypothetical protein